MLVGLGVGVPLAWGLSPSLGVGLLGADPRDPLLYVVAPLAVVASALVAGLGPMRRAVGISITEGLRAE